MKNCIVVLGMHRSGTSVLTGLMSILGGYAGSDLMPPTEDNPKGYFENNRVVRLNEKILSDNNATWDDPLFTLDSVSEFKINEYVSEAKAILNDEFKYVKNIIIKDPRLCILFPIWERALKELKTRIKIIFIYRSPLEVASSLKKRKRDGLSFEHGLILWIHLFLQAEFFSRPYKPLFVEYDKDFQDLPHFLEKLQQFLGGKLTKSIIQKAQKFYLPKLKHHQIPLDNISNDLPVIFKKLVAILAENKIQASRRKLNEIRKELAYTSQLFLADWYQNKAVEKKKTDLENQLKTVTEEYTHIKSNLENQLSQQKSSNEQLNQENSTLKDRLVQLEQDLEQKSQELEQKNQELEQKSQELDQKNQELVQKTQKLNQEIEQKNQEIKQKEEALSAVEQKSLVQLNTGMRNADILFQSLFTNKSKYKQFSKHFANKTKIFPFLRKNETTQLLKEKKIIEQSGLFSPVYYLTTYPDIWDAGVDPLLHFCRRGWKEGRQPNADFDLVSYVENNPEISRRNINPLIYYINNGKIEEEIPLKENKTSLLKKLKKVKEGNKYTYFLPELTSEIKEEIKNFTKKPLMSIIIPVYNVDPKWLEKAILSVKNQWYENWEINIADDASTNTATVDFLKTLDHPRINIKFLKENGNISKASNEALNLAKGEYIVLMDHDDEITPDALYEVVKTINKTGADFIYSDEDKLDMDGKYCDPHFKPDFSPDMFLSQNYLSHLGVIKKSLVTKVKGWTLGLEGSQDYDLYLKVLEYTDRIIHIPKVLYHWRMVPGSTAAQFDDKSYAQEAGRKAVINALARRKVAVKSVENGIDPGTYRIKYKILNEPLVSIVIPFKDKPELLYMCVSSILEKSTYQNYEIIGISNNSEEKDTFAMMESLQDLDKRIHFYEYNKAFNYSAINNYAVSHYVNGKHVLLLNNDIEIITPEWIEELLMFSQRDDVGVVGAKLYYPNDTIQHAGVIIGIGGVAGHSHKHFPRNSHGYFSRLNIPQNLSAVTAACLMVKKKIYEDLGGLNEKELKIAFNDVDFCLRAREMGYLNVFTPYCEAYHHESISRGAEDTPEKKARFNMECSYMKKRHRDIINRDIYYNKNLTVEHENFSLSSDKS